MMVCGSSLLVSATMIELFDEAMSSSAVSNFNSEPRLKTVIMNMNMPSMPGMMMFDRYTL